METFACQRGLHIWATEDEAKRCCNGFIRVTAPFSYGLTKTMGGVPVDRAAWYQPRRLWKSVLIAEENTAEIERLISLAPMEMLSSTQQNPWLVKTQ